MERPLHPFTSPTGILRDVVVKEKSPFENPNELLKGRVINYGTLMRGIEELGYATKEEYQTAKKGGMTKYKLRRVLIKGKGMLHSKNRTIHIHKDHFDTIYLEVIELLSSQLKGEISKINKSNLKEHKS